MPSIFARALYLAAIFALPAFGREWIEQQEQAEGLTVRDYYHEDAFTEFSIPCPGCFEADESLVFQLQVLATEDLATSDIRINYEPFPLTWNDFYTSAYRNLTVLDTAGNAHVVEFSLVGFVSASSLSLFVPGYATQTVYFVARLADGIPTHSSGFTAIMRPNVAGRRLVQLIPDATSEIIEFHTSQDSFSILDGSTSSEEEDFDRFDLVNEVETLGLLEAQAAELHIQVAAKKDAISARLRLNREKLCLKHLIKECDGVVCAARVIAQRICDKLGINIDPKFGYKSLDTRPHQHSLSLDQNVSHINSTHHEKHTAQAMNMPLMLTQNGTTHYRLQAIDLVNPPNPLVRILEIIAAILGLATFAAFIRRKCASARSKAERAADREEKRNERAYRRAARRALMRKRWDGFVNTVSCFRVRDDTRIEDYEEKRALILQDAFLEQEADLAEKGEVMEAEIRELRYAHEIVSSLVRVDENRFELITPVHDPPPPLVPLPYTPATARSRASTHTLPSYTSESLPDYTSRYSRERRASDSTDGFTPSTTESGVTPSNSRSETSGPSSVLEMSPRPSAETLRTSRPSGDTQR